MVVLDTDHISILQYEDQGAEILERRLAASPEETCVTIVSFQEQARGWLAFLHRARKRDQVLNGYAKLQALFEFYSGHDILPFGDSAMYEFEQLQQQRLRIGTNDLRIAAIAKANNAKLLSRNLRDFRLVPGLDVEDWTV